jgi:hypothetical protein
MKSFSDFSGKYFLFRNEIDYSFEKKCLEYLLFHKLFLIQEKFFFISVSLSSQSRVIHYIKACVRDVDEHLIRTSLNIKLDVLWTSYGHFLDPKLGLFVISGA